MVRRILILTLFVALVAAPALSAVVTESFAGSAAVGEKHDKININTASAKDLQKLDGIGRTVAERIVHYRDELNQMQTAVQTFNVQVAANTAPAPVTSNAPAAQTQPGGLMALLLRLVGLGG